MDAETPNLPELFQLAEAVVPSGMLPKHIRNPGQAVAIILAGREMGMQPMESLRCLHMVQGRVVVSAAAQLAMAAKCGVSWQWLKADHEVATIEMNRPGFPPHTETFTMADAKRAGLAGRDIWKKYPRAMLKARCTTEAIRSYCPDVLGGPSYTAEELEDGTNGQYEHPGEPLDVLPITPTLAIAEGPEQPEPPTPSKHHPSWERDKGSFFVRLTEATDLKYGPLADFLAWLGKPLLSAMDTKQRNALVAWLSGERAAVQREAWEAETGQDGIVLDAGNAPAEVYKRELALAEKEGLE